MLSVISQHIFGEYQDQLWTFVQIAFIVNMYGESLHLIVKFFLLPNTFLFVISCMQLGALDDVQLVVNKMRDRKNGEGCVPGLDEIGELMALPLLGVVPEDDRAIIASCKGEPVITVANSAAGKAWISIIERLFGKEVR